MILYFVRHGQSVGNVLRTFHGQTDYPLTETGWEQARACAEKLRSVQFTRCYASDLQRAWNTALCCLEGRDVVPEVCVGLREQFVGDMEGLSWDEVEARWPGLAETYCRDWKNTTPPAAESPREMLARVGKAVDEIIAGGEDTLIAAHYGSLSMLLVHLGLLDAAKVMTTDLHFVQGAYSAIEITDNGAKLLCLNK